MLVSDWKECWKWLSVHAGALIAILGAAQASLPYLQASIPPNVFAGITSGLGILVIVARVIHQGGAETVAGPEKP